MERTDNANTFSETIASLDIVDIKALSEMTMALVRGLSKTEAVSRLNVMLQAYGRNPLPLPECAGVTSAIL